MLSVAAENAAMANKVRREWTFDNIASRKRSSNPWVRLDWSRESTTLHAEYYRWNQWLFLRMLEMGVAYQKTGESMGSLD